MKSKNKQQFNNSERKLLLSCDTKSRLVSIYYTSVFAFAFLITVFFVLFSSSNKIYSIPVLKYASDFLLNNNYIPALFILIPVVSSVAQIYPGLKSERFRDIVLINTPVISLILLFLIFPTVLKEDMVFSYKDLFYFGLNFKIDILSYLLMFTASILWLTTLLYSRSYVACEKHRYRFYFILTIVFTGILGTLMASDIFTLFFFSEITLFASFFLVCHSGNKQSLQAGKSYIYLGFGGTLLITLGMLLLYTNTKSFEFSEAFSFSGGITTKYLIVVLLISGFGLKAGMFPFHSWLPKAHSVAPSPVSAIQSGLIIKLGAYAIFRILSGLFTSSSMDFGKDVSILSSISENTGLIIITLGAITMIYGASISIFQINMKRLLAYSSINQIGYIILFIGVIFFLGSERGLIGYFGSYMHMINHLLFKSLLFLGAGVIYLYSGEQNMYKLGGLWRKLPLTALLFLIGVLGATGMPLFNGFISKTVFHEIIKECCYNKGYLYILLKYLFIAANIISASAFIKLFALVFLGKLPDKYKHKNYNAVFMNIAMGGLAIAIIFTGINPYYIVHTFIVPSAYQISFFVITKSGLDFINNINYFSIENILSYIYTIIPALMLSYIVVKIRFFAYRRVKSLRDISYVGKSFIHRIRQPINELEHNIIKNDVFIFSAFLIIVITSLIITL